MHLVRFPSFESGSRRRSARLAWVPAVHAYAYRALAAGLSAPKVNVCKFVNPLYKIPAPAGPRAQGIMGHHVSVVVNLKASMGP